MLKLIGIVILVITLPMLFWTSAWKSYQNSDYYQHLIAMRKQEQTK